MCLSRVILAAVAATAAFAQSAGSLAGDAKSTFQIVKGAIVKSAEKMPAEHFDFKPTPEVRSFGQILAHVADANYGICGAAKDEKKAMGIEKSMTARADIVKALNESFAYCDSVFDGMTDAKAAEKGKFFGREMSKLAILNFNTAHDFEHYGNLVTYMRMKGIVPPSSEPRR